MMQKITLSAAGWQGPEDMHKALKKALAFPDHYGMNMNALHDCLTDLDSIHLTLTGCSAAKARMPEKWAVLEKVLADSARENPGFTFTLLDEAGDEKKNHGLPGRPAQPLPDAQDKSTKRRLHRLRKRGKRKAGLELLR